MISSLIVVTLLVMGLLLYWFPLRRWYRRWGAGEADLTRAVSPEAEVRNPNYKTVLAVTIDAS